MWDFMVEHCNDGVKPKLDKSAFVGDAAGRAVGWKAGRKKGLFMIASRSLL